MVRSPDSTDATGLEVGGDPCPEWLGVDRIEKLVGSPQLLESMATVSRVSEKIPVGVVELCTVEQWIVITEESDRLGKPDGRLVGTPSCQCHLGMQPDDPRPKIHPACVSSLLQLSNEDLGGVNVANPKRGDDE